MRAAAAQWMQVRAVGRASSRSGAMAAPQTSHCPYEPASNRRSASVDSFRCCSACASRAATCARSKAIVDALRVVLVVRVGRQGRADDVLQRPAERTEPGRGPPPARRRGPRARPLPRPARSLSGPAAVDHEHRAGDQPGGVRGEVDHGVPTPALFTRTSIRPCRSTVRVTAADARQVPDVDLHGAGLPATCDDLGGNPSTSSVVRDPATTRSVRSNDGYAGTLRPSGRPLTPLLPSPALMLSLLRPAGALAQLAP